MNMKSVAGTVSAVFFAFGSQAGVSLAPLFTDRMVLQRETPVPIWGKAAPGEEVTVLFEDQVKTTKAGTDGAWLLKLDALKASAAGETLTVKGSNEIVLKDVLVGEVWLCSGQSNMEMGLGLVKDGQKELAAANHPSIRIFHVENYFSPNAERRLPTAWKACSPESVAEGGWGGVSAAGYFFARELNKTLNVPVGLIESDWGGTPAEAWTELKHLEAAPALARHVAAFKSFEAALSEAKCQEKFGRSRMEVGADMEKCVADPGVKPEAATWGAASLDVSSWEKVQVPSGWFGDRTIQGAVWFRRDVEIPAENAGKDLELNLGVVYAGLAVFFNGEKLDVAVPKDKSSPSVIRKFAVPGRLVKAGANSLAIRVFNGGDSKGFLSGANELFIGEAGANSLKISGEWSREVENAIKVLPRGPNPQSTPAFLYNAMIAPLIPYAIRGAIWYQGEANAWRAHEYRTLFPTLIKSWRDEWGQGAFPFYFVQLANFRDEANAPGESEWAELREAQALAGKSVFNAGMAVAIDIGDAHDVHAKNKLDVGRRLALLVLARTYGQALEFSGPVPRDLRLRGDALEISFDHGEGMTTKDGGPLKGFAVCGSDRKFVFADAKIEGSSVFVSSPAVKAPLAVRYAWADNPSCNLCNKAGLPAAPFRTDDFPLTTEGR